MKFFKNNNKYFLSLIIFSLIYGSIFTFLKIAQHRSFFSYEYEDDARVVQLIHNTSKSFSTPYQTIFQSDNKSIFDDHFSPLYYVLAVYYKLFPHTYSIFVLICFSYGVSVLLIFKFAKDLLKNDKHAFVISLIYLFYPPLHYTMLGSLGIKIFVLPLFLMNFFYLHKKNFTMYMISLILTCLAMEDIAFIFIMIGVYQIFKKYPLKWWLTTILFSIIYLIFSVYMSEQFCRIRIFEDDANFAKLNYLNFNAIIFVFKEYLLNLNNFLSLFTWIKLRFLVFLLGPLLFLPLFSVQFYLPIVIFFEIIVANNTFKNQNSYYLATIIPFIFIGFIFAINNLKKIINTKIINFILYSIMIVCIINLFTRNIIGPTSEENILLGAQAPILYNNESNFFIKTKNIFKKEFYTLSLSDKTAWELINIIPKKASVTATGDLLPALANRKTLYEFGLNHPKAYYAFNNVFNFDNYQAYTVDYILVNRKLLINGLGGHYAYLVEKKLNKELKKLINKYNFYILKEKDDFILLKNSTNLIQ